MATNRSKFKSLPRPLQILSASCLDKNELIAFSQTCSVFARIGKKLLRPAKLIYAIRHRKPEFITALAEEEKDYLEVQKLPHLLLQKRNFTDLRGREFINTSLWQYLWWAWDCPMIYFLLPVLASQNEAAMVQIAELKKVGISYRNPSLDAKRVRNLVNEKHFDFTPLDTAYTNCDNNRSNQNWLAIEFYIRNLPLNLLFEYFRQDGIFAPHEPFDPTKLVTPELCAWDFLHTRQEFDLSNLYRQLRGFTLYRAGNMSALTMEFMPIDEEIITMDQACIRALRDALRTALNDLFEKRLVVIPKPQEIQAGCKCIVM